MMARHISLWCAIAALAGTLAACASGDDMRAARGEKPDGKAAAALMGYHGPPRAQSTGD